MCFMELQGFEPWTFCMPCRRAPNCATAPMGWILLPFIDRLVKRPVRFLEKKSLLDVSGPWCSGRAVASEEVAEEACRCYGVLSGSAFFACEMACQIGVGLETA